MNAEGVARRYAEALLGAVPDGQRKAADHELRDVVSVIGSEPLNTVWRHPGIPAAQKRAVMEKIFHEEPWALRLANVLLDHGRESLFIETARAFHAERLEAEGRTSAVVRTARPVDDAWRARIVEALTRRIGQPVDAAFEVDAGLLGGIEVRFRDELMDGTVRGRLRRLRRALKDEVVNS